MNRIAMQQKLTQMFLSQEAGAPGNNRKRAAKAMPKIEVFTENICFNCSPMQVVVFCKHVSIL